MHRVSVTFSTFHLQILQARGERRGREQGKKQHARLRAESLQLGDRAGVETR